MKSKETVCKVQSEGDFEGSLCDYFKTLICVNNLWSGEKKFAFTYDMCGTTSVFKINILV